MSGIEVLERLRQEAIDEVAPFYVKHGNARLYHVFWMSSGVPITCLCGKYTLSSDDSTQDKEKIHQYLGAKTVVKTNPTLRLPVMAIVPPEEVAKACLRRHDHLIDLKVEAKRESLKAELRKIGDDLEEIIGDHVFLAIHTLDTEPLHRLADVIGLLVVDAEIMRMLKKHRPAETETLLKGLETEKKGGNSP